MNDNLNLTVKSKEFDTIIAPMSLDLLAFFKLLEEDIYKVTNKADKEGWSPEKLIKEIEGLI